MINKYGGHVLFVLFITTLMFVGASALSSAGKKAEAGEVVARVEADQTMIGRYHISSEANATVKIDTITGKAWILRADVVGFGDREYEWTAIK